MGNAGEKYILSEGPVGNTAALTCATGWFCRGFANRYRTADDQHGAHFARLDTPTETLIQDIFVHKDLSSVMPPEVELYSQLVDTSFGSVFERSGSRLPFSESVVELGQGLVTVATPEIPLYTDVVKSVFDRVNWDPDDFTAYRFKMRFPPIASVAVLRYELPERTDA
jgi:hypothetical protein